METKSWIDQYKVIAIVRGVEPKNIINTAQALYDGGIRLLEITFNQSRLTCIQDTARNLSMLAEAMGDRMCIGAGTVMNRLQAETAIQSGARYIISPDTNPDVIEKTRSLGAISIPGALTPTEIAYAYRCGADYVKLFPAGTLGLKYIQAVCSPLSHIPMMAVGGIDDKNLNSFLSSGLAGVGIGSNLVNLAMIANGQFEALTRLAQKYTVRQ